MRGPGVEGAGGGGERRMVYGLPSTLVKMEVAEEGW